MSGSKDGMVQMMPIKKGKNPFMMAGVRMPCGVFFDATGTRLYAVSKTAKVFWYAI